MPLSLRIPPETEKLVEKAAQKAGKTKSTYIIDAVNEKLGIVKNREQVIRETAGWMSHEEAEELRRSVQAFARVEEADWE